jgi:ATP-dependent helicase/nuclease subunit B
MPEIDRARLYAIPLGVSLADTLADYLLKKAGGRHEALADTLILLPNNRAIRALTDSFVRRADNGLLLPRMVALGDLTLDDTLGPLLDPLGSAGHAIVPPAIRPIDRQILLTKLIRQQRPAVTAVEALRLAKRFGETIDQLDVEEIGLDKVRENDPRDDLSTHWQSAYGDFLDIAFALNAELMKRGQINPAARRNALLHQFAASLNRLPSQVSLIAAGITTAAPAVANLLKTLSRQPGSLFVWPHVDLAMADDDWDALGSATYDEDLSLRAEETHPQFHLKLLFDRMAVRREEIAIFPGIRADAKLAVVDDLFCRADSTLSWIGLAASKKRLDNVRTLTAADSAEEALSIAILIRQALEQPAKRIALVTPDRELAVRVAAQLLRWGVQVDDSAGQPLVQLPPATLLLALAETFADQFGPVSLLAVLKHPLVTAGEERLGWLEKVRQLDLVLRGPRLGIGLPAVSDAIEQSKASENEKNELTIWWTGVSAMLVGLNAKASDGLSAIIDKLTVTADALTSGKIWQGQAGRQSARVLEDYRATDLSALGRVDRGAAPALIRQLLDTEVIRPVYGSHPRVAIYGLLEARLQQADMVICGGLNEGSWPQMPQPDPWLAPRLRRQLNLPGLDRNIGLSAHDLSSLLGAKEVVLTRAERDRGGPTKSSRFVLRMQALFGKQLQEETHALALARSVDLAPAVLSPPKPAPMPDREQRRIDISVTQIELLKADPYSFYARHILGLNSLDRVGAEPSAAWRGTVVHDVLEQWAKHDDFDPAKLAARADALIANPAFHPAVRVLWQPRVTAGLDWIAAETAKLRAEGRVVISAEKAGRLQLAGVTLKGRADRIDRAADGSLVVVDYKTGQAPTTKSVISGYRLQLGLIGAMAQAGVIEGVKGTATAFEYWSLSKRGDGDFGKISEPISEKSRSKGLAPEDFVGFSISQAREAIEFWITGSAPFTAKLNPEYALYGDYDQLMRLPEWYGRETVDG